MRDETQYVAPVSIDFGAMHTGVFRACYPRGTSIVDFMNQAETRAAGEVLHLDKNYTLLMRERTQARHIRRCNDRRKMAKRLLLVVLEGYFGFPAREHQQALGFFLNRRGFSRLEESFSMEALQCFPDAAWDMLPDDLQKKFGLPGQLAETFEGLVNEDASEFLNLDQEVSKYLAPFQSAKLAAGYSKKVCGAIQKRMQGTTVQESKNSRNKLSRLPTGVLTMWRQLDSDILEDLPVERGQADLLAWLNKADQNALQRLQQQMEGISKRLQSQATSILADLRYQEFDAAKHAAALDDPEHKEYLRRHLEHLFFAIHKVAEEVRSGARHRRKYFEEIRHDLEHAATHPHRYMQRFAAALQQHETLDVEKLCRLICHISNLELKPLRAYFDDKAHRQRDQWQPKRLAAIVSRWFMKQWRVNAGKDGQEKVKSYQLLCKEWREYPDKDDIIGFWLDADPELTIPPYQSHTNRRPPDCQSLILNPDYLKRYYPHWSQWLEQMSKAEGVLVPEMEEPKSGKGQSLVGGEEMALRELQTLLDRRKDADPLCLNAIWSHYHQSQKFPEDSKKHHTAICNMNEAVARSALPDELKRDLRWGEKGSFGHFLNKYYQSRRRARDGRYFIHPVRGKKHAWHDDSCLLTMCHHRPRQKKHQLLPDVAALLGLHPDELRGCLNQQELSRVLADIAGFKETAKQAARAQEEHRGELKSLLQAESIKELNKLKKRVKEKAAALGEALAQEDDALQQHIRERATDVFFFAQMHNLVFEDRSGFSSTCPVCSADNARRMQQDEHGHAFASRLSALSMRVIDGAVRKLVEHKAREISQRHWQMIEPKLEAGSKVCVPLVLEQNRFEFEPELARLKGRTLKSTADTSETRFDEKRERIRNQAQGICAYTGQPLGGDGEYDHIIPRASRYGTLNDEANLIYVSAKANNTKDNSFYHLSDLHATYKQQQFGTVDDTEIKRQIYQELVGVEPHDPLPERFSFGSYLNFLNLTDDQARAMRHALFLDEGDPLRQMVIRALQNRNRTFVNGTQRYFAQVIADNLFEMAKRKGVEKQISFDYFEYPADPNHPKGTQLLRRDLQDQGLVVPAKDTKDKVQEAYSHFIDAQMAFLLAAEDHKNDGSMGLTFAEGETIWPVSHTTGEIGSAHVYERIRLIPEDIKEVSLERTTTVDHINTLIQNNRPLHQAKLRQLFKNNALRMDFKPIFKFKETWYKGYPKAVSGGWDCDSFARKFDEGSKARKAVDDKFGFYRLAREEKDLKLYLPVRKAGKRALDAAIAKHFGQGFEYKTEEAVEVLKGIIENCKIILQKTPLVEAPNILNNQNAKNHPSIENWQRFDAMWKKEAGDAYKIKKDRSKLIYDISADLQAEWEQCCRKFLKIGKQHPFKKSKARKVFSMTAVATASGTLLMTRRKGGSVYQVVPVDNNNLPKELVPFLVKQSRNLSWPHHKAPEVLATPVEQYHPVPVNGEIDPSMFFRAFEENSWEGKTTVLLNGTSAHVSGWPRKELEKIIPKPWEDGKSFTLSKEICQELNKLLKRSVRSDGKLCVKLEEGGTTCTVILPFKTDSLRKLLV